MSPPVAVGRKEYQLRRESRSYSAAKPARRLLLWQQPSTNTTKHHHLWVYLILPILLARTHQALRRRLKRVNMSAFNDTSQRRRACDLCRRNKLRCNPPASRDIPCARCARSDLKCTFQEDSKKRAPPKGYILALENRCKQLESLVKRIDPNLDLESEVGPSFTQDTWNDESTLYHQSRPASQTSSSRKVTPSALEPPVRFEGDVRQVFDPALDCDADSTGQIEKELEALDLGKDVGRQYLGKHLGVIDLIRTAFNLKDGGTEKPDPQVFTPARAKYWEAPQWRKELNPKPSVIPATWPPDDVQEQLVNLYFDKGTLLIPIVHRLSFERNFKRGLHKRDVDFGRLAAVVLALGCRFCDDPRVCVPGDDGEVDRTSAGWAYFIQIQPLNHGHFGPCSLSHLQTLALSVLYMQFVGGSLPAWQLSGIGVRTALDIGLHTEKVYVSDHPLKSQAWRRTFWTLVSLDIMISGSLGRPCAIALEEIDAELPLDVDYEHYDEATRQWKYPESLPSRTSSFVQFLKLHKISALMAKTVYNIHPITVTELDDRLSSWHNELPSYLRWDPHAEDQIFLQQAGVLRLFFLHNQIAVHRQFLPVMSPDTLPSALSMAAVAICSTAAQSTVRILLCLQQAEHLTFPFTWFAFEAAIILLINIWVMERKDPSHVAISRWMEDVHRCIDIIREGDKRWRAGARILDILEELSSMSAIESGATSVVHSQKRAREHMDGDDVNNRSFVRAFRHHPLSASTGPITDAGTQFPPLEGEESVPFFSLNPGAMDLGAIPWDANIAEGFAPPINTTFDMSGLSSLYGGDSFGFGGFLQEVPLPDNAFQNLFGGMDDLYGGQGMVYGELYSANNGWGGEEPSLSLYAAGQQSTTSDQLDS